MLTNDQIIERGRVAARLLADDEAMSFFKELQQTIMASSFSKASTDSCEREAVYHQLKGIADVLDYLATYKAAGEDVLRRLNEPEETYDD